MKTEGKYKNGQDISVQKGTTLTYFYKNGLMRAKGKSVAGVMQGKWTFNRESGKLWVIGNFKDNKKHGLWLRYDKSGKEEYRAKFVDGKEVKNATKRPKKKVAGSSRR